MSHQLQTNHTITWTNSVSLRPVWWGTAFRLTSRVSTSIGHLHGRTADKRFKYHLSSCVVIELPHVLLTDRHSCDSPAQYLHCVSDGVVMSCRSDSSPSGLGVKSCYHTPSAFSESSVTWEMDVLQLSSTDSWVWGKNVKALVLHCICQHVLGHHLGALSYCQIVALLPVQSHCWPERLTQL